MKIYQKRNLLAIGIPLYFVVAYIISRLLQGEIVLYINLLLFGAYFLLYLKWWRCPYCLRNLGRIQFPTITCPYCGKDIPKE